MKNLKKRIRFFQHYFTLLFKYGLKSAKKYRLDFHYLYKDYVNMVGLHLPNEEDLQIQKHTQFKKNVKISILTPLFNTDELFLKELIESVQVQTYPNWELVLCDASDSDHAYVHDIVCEYQQKDARIVYKKLEKNEGISGNTNACIHFSTGDYYALLDHDDTLHPSALFEVMKEIENGADFIYTDEVKYFGDVKKIENKSFFNLKAGFSQEELQSHNYICHFNVYSRVLLESLDEPYYRKEYDGSQDHDMVLRLTEKANHIVHIPKVLYYWRFHEGSVSMNLDSKSYAVDAAHKAIQESLNRKKVMGRVESNLPYQTIYKLNLEIYNPLVSVLLYGNKQNYEKIVENTNYTNVEYIFIEESFNSTLEHANGSYIISYNMNLIPQNKDWIQNMLMYAQFENVGVVGPMIQDFDESIWDAGSVFNGKEILNIGRHYWDFDEGYEACLKYVRATSLLTIDCMMIKRKDLHSFSSDVQLCTSLMEKGKINIWTCFSCVKAQKKMPIKNIEVSEEFSKEHPIVKKDPLFNMGWEKLKLM